MMSLAHQMVIEDLTKSLLDHFQICFPVYNKEIPNKNTNGNSSPSALHEEPN